VVVVMVVMKLLVVAEQVDLFTILQCQYHRDLYLLLLVQVGQVHLNQHML
jgi:hypothetical protein